MDFEGERLGLALRLGDAFFGDARFLGDARLGEDCFFGDDFLGETFFPPRLAGLRFMGLLEAAMAPLLLLLFAPCCACSFCLLLPVEEVGFLRGEKK